MTNSENNPGIEKKEAEFYGADSEGNCHGGGRRWLWFIPLILIAIAVKGAIFMWLWNCLIPEIFNGPVLTYLQAIGLMFLAKMLVGFRGGHHGGGRFGKKWGGGGMKGRFWTRMSPEERCDLRDHLRKRWKKEE